MEPIEQETGYVEFNGVLPGENYEEQKKMEQATRRKVFQGFKNSNFGIKKQQKPHKRNHRRKITRFNKC
jgi:hypothetical protein